MKPYRAVFNDTALRALLALPRRQRGALLDRVDWLSANLEGAADFEEVGAAGRTYYVTCLDSWVITFWPDHGSAELRILLIERAN